MYDVLQPFFYDILIWVWTRLVKRVVIVKHRIWVLIICHRYCTTTREKNTVPSFPRHNQSAAARDDYKVSLTEKFQ